MDTMQQFQLGELATAARRPCRPLRRALRAPVGAAAQPPRHAQCRGRRHDRRGADPRPAAHPPRRHRLRPAHARCAAPRVLHLHRPLRQAVDAQERRQAAGDPVRHHPAGAGHAEPVRCAARRRLGCAPGLWRPRGLALLRRRPGHRHGLGAGTERPGPRQCPCGGDRCCNARHHRRRTRLRPGHGLDHQAPQAARQQAAPADLTFAPPPEAEPQRRPRAAAPTRCSPPSS